MELIKEFHKDPALGILPVVKFSKSYNLTAVEELSNFAIDFIPQRFQGYREILKAATRKADPSGVDIVHHTFYLPGFLGKYPGIPSVSTLYDMIPEILVDGKSSINPHLLKREYILKSDLVLSISENSTSDMFEVYGRNVPRPKTTYLGVDSKFRPNLKPINSMPKKYLIYCGQRTGYKNIELAYRALALLWDKWKVPLYLIGGGGLSRSEISVLRKLNIIDAVHQVDISEEELPNFYANASALLFTSKYEGFGFPPLEAMASGIPALVSDTKVAREIYGDAAIYFEPDNPLALRDLIEMTYLGEFNTKDHVEARHQLVRRLSWRACAEKTAEAYKALLEKR